MRCGKRPNRRDDVAVVARPFRRLRVAERLGERDRALLVGRIFGVRERQIEEAAQLRRHRPVVLALDRAVGNVHRHGVGPVGAPGAAEHVARELVEEQAQRQRAFRHELPLVEVAARRRLVGEEEALPAGLVEGVVLGKPLVRPGGAPERQHLLDRGVALHAAALKSEKARRRRAFLDQFVPASRRAYSIDTATKRTSP